MNKPFTAAILLLLTSRVAAPQSSAAQFALSGAGTTSCGSYAAASKKENLAALHVSWAQGFLSGMNLAYARSSGKDLVLLPDSDTIQLYLDKYCRNNPLKSPLDGASNLFDELRK